MANLQPPRGVREGAPSNGRGRSKYNNHYDLDPEAGDR